MGVDAEMFVRVRPALGEKQVKRLGYELGAAFGADRFLVQREETPWSKPHGPLSVVSRFTQDGPDIRPEAGEQFVRVHLYDRYYGEGYERGDFPIIAMIAEWLEHRIRSMPGNEKADVWYGGDSSGITAEKFDGKARLELLKHFVAEGHRPYRGVGWGGDGMSKHCDFCDEPMRSYMSGGVGVGGFCCDGCGATAITRDGGKSWSPADDEYKRATPVTDGSTGWVPACLEHPDCRESPKLGAACYRASEEAKGVRRITESNRPDQETKK